MYQKMVNVGLLSVTMPNCYLCGEVAAYRAINSGRYRCREKITQCSGFIANALKIRKERYPRKIRETKERGPVSDLAKSRMREAASKRDNSKIGKYHRTEEHRLALRLAMYEKLDSGKLVVRHNTKPELEFADYLNKAGIGFKKQFVIQFGKIGINRFRHAYDFHILDTNILVEIDGDYWHSRPGAVERDIECDRIASDRGFHVIRIKTSELKSSLKILEGLI